MSVRAFRFGVAIHTAGSRRDWQERARRAEAYGYDILLVPDHVEGQLSPFPALTGAADATRSLRVGTFVLNNDLRHPLMVANAAATLDLMTDGRFELGLGAGWYAGDYEQTGITLHPGGVRVQRLEESVQIVKQFLAGTAVAFAGRHYTVSFPGTPPGAPSVRVPLMIGGGGKRILALAAREADVVGLRPRALTDPRLDPASASPAATTRAVQWIQESARERSDRVELNAFVQNFAITDRPLDVARSLSVGWRLSPADFLSQPYQMIGPLEVVIEKLQRCRHVYGITYFVVLDANMDSFSPVVARLAGT